MAWHRTSEEFYPAKEDWISYTERLQQSFTANDMDNPNKQHAILLSMHLRTSDLPDSQKPGSSK